MLRIRNQACQSRHAISFINTGTFAQHEQCDQRKCNTSAHDTYYVEHNLDATQEVPLCA
jgi:hypothetical protein